MSQLVRKVSIRKNKHDKTYTQYSEAMAALILTRWAKRRLDFMRELRQDEMMVKVSFYYSDEGRNIDENHVIRNDHLRYVGSIHS